MTDLEERMRLTVLGQVTWAEPEKEARCAACAYWAQKSVRNGVEMGFCNLVKAHSRMKQHLFAGQEAIACSQFLRRPLVGGAQ